MSTGTIRKSRKNDTPEMNGTQRPCVVILYNEPVLPEDHPDAESEREILFTVAEVEKHLAAARFPVYKLGVSRDARPLLDGLQEIRPGVVFNLFEGTGDHGHTEAYVAGLLEWYGIPFTGCPAHALGLARDKARTKYLLRGAGLPTAPFFVVEELPVPANPLTWPVIVKPVHQDASVGIDQGSVVTDHDQLTRRVVRLLEAYGPPVLVEEFIPGRELNLALIEYPDLMPLPLSEIEFVDADPSFWPIITYDAKWTPGSREYEATPPRYPAKVTPGLARRLEAVGRQAFRLLGCRDFARIDFRVKPSGKPYILEVNPNPDFSPNAGFSGGLYSAGITHAQFTVDLVWAAWKRGDARSPAPAHGNHLEKGR
jgi:D-alanine-D-alanine ligase